MEWALGDSYSVDGWFKGRKYLAGSNEREAVRTNSFEMDGSEVQPTSVYIGVSCFTEFANGDGLLTMSQRRPRGTILKR